MNPGMPGQPQSSAYLPPPPPAPPEPYGGLKKNPVILVAGALLSVLIFCSWLVGSFNIDGDGGRFLRHTGGAAGATGLGLFLLTAFTRLTEKDKDHPVGFGMAFVVVMLLLGVIGLGGALSQMR
ncbi:MAG: hypothetical protein ACHREM_17725 [Polyangiales bacterium]